MSNIIKRESALTTEVCHILTIPFPLSDSVNKILGMGLFTLLMTLGAFVRFYLPFTPVPITLQTLIMLMAGAFLGYGWGAGAMGLYICLGLCGLPIFAGASSGMGYILGPTGGYLIGFMAGAWIVGHILNLKNTSSWPRIAGAFLIAHIALYALGISQLLFWSGCNVRNALFMGLIPFIPGDIIKIVLAGIIIKNYRRLKKLTI